MTTPETILGHTRAVCPECLTALPATLVERGESVFLCRVCPVHGNVESLVWQGAPRFTDWRRPKKNTTTAPRQTDTSHGCPHDCGLCPEHSQKSCSVLYELTTECNLHCPVCFAAAGGAEEQTPETPFTALARCTLEEHKAHLRWIHSQAGQAVLQLSGGEPTLSPFLPSLVEEAARLFPAVQLNTNGLLLAERPELATALADAGLSWVFLQFDGTTDAIFTALRGRPLLGAKLRALAHCQQAGLAVVLVPTVVRGVNDHDLGNLVRFAREHAPTVRGLHLQPITRSGRTAFGSTHHQITLPEILQLLAQQTDGLIRPEHATPPGCEHERCSFHCRYLIEPGGGLQPLREQGCCCPEPETTEAGANKAISSIMRNWQKAQAPPTGDGASGDEASTRGAPPGDAFDAFIAKARAHTLSITCMAFQDAWNLDLERLQGCCIHVFLPPGRLVPFCACNLTSSDGQGLYRKGRT